MCRLPNIVSLGLVDLQVLCLDSLIISLCETSSNLTSSIGPTIANENVDFTVGIQDIPCGESLVLKWRATVTAKYEHLEMSCR